MQPNADTCYVFFVIEAMAYLSLQTAKAKRHIDGKSQCTNKDHVQESLSQNRDESRYSQVNDREFQMQYRMNRSSFKKLHGLIKDHPIFNKREKGRSQFTSEYLLLFLLAFLGTEENEMSNQKAQSTFPSGQVTFDLFKKQCITAIIKILYIKAYYWPDEEEERHYLGQ
jgi:hypothetical protein